MNQISFRELLKASWAMYKPHWAKFTILSLVVIAFRVVPVLAGGLGSVGYVLTILVSMVISFLISYLAVYAAHNEKISFGQIVSKHTGSLFLNSIWASVILTAIIHYPFMIGLISGIFGLTAGVGILPNALGLLFVLVYLFFVINVSFSRFYIIKPELKAWASIKSSWRSIRKHQWKVIWIFVCLFFFNLLGALALGLGVLVTAPVSMVLMALLAKSLYSEGAPVLSPEIVEPSGN